MPLLGAFIVPHPPLIVHEVGRGEEKKISATVNAYQEISKRIALIKPETIIVFSPHSPSYSDYFHIASGAVAYGSFKEFNAPEVHFNVDYDEGLVKAISDLASKEKIPAGTLGERNERLDHGIMVPLYFINQVFKDYHLVKISLSGLTPVVHYRLGKCIAQAIEQTGKKVVIVASGDLSHKLTKDGPYGFAKEGPEFDRQVTKAFAKGDFLSLLTLDENLCIDAAECGLGSFQIMAGAFDGLAVQAELLSYEGPFGVGYGVAAFTPSGKDEKRHYDQILLGEEEKKTQERRSHEDAYLRLARASLEYFVLNGKTLPKPEGLPPEMENERAGVFVSIKKFGHLRGCIGTISPAQASIALEIIHNAVSAGSEDPRFDAVHEDELPDLVYDVDILGRPEKIASMAELDPKHYGVIVSCNGRRGLLLPDLEGIDTPQKQVRIALDKAGIDEDESYSMQRFKVTRHE